MAELNKTPFGLFTNKLTSKYSIKDIERLSGIKAHTVRIWEQRYDILKPARTDTNIRTYDDEDLKRILNISLLNNNGYKISSIAKLSDMQLVDEVNKVLSSSSKESLQVDTLVICLLDMDEARFESTVNNSILQFGFESTVENVLFPFLRQLGNMWQVGIVSPAQEHYITNMIRQKLIVGLDRVVPAKNPNQKTIILFLPDQEMHELGLIYAHYLAKHRGHKCLYLGQSLPVSELLVISDNVKPDLLITILTGQMSEANLQTLVESCSSGIPNATLLVSGRLLFTGDYSRYFNGKNISIFKDFVGFKALL